MRIIGQVKRTWVIPQLETAFSQIKTTADLVGDFRVNHNNTLTFDQQRTWIIWGYTG
jgi:hypothetical protein